MSFSSIVTMLVIVALVWGGLVGLILWALRKEARRRR